MPQTTEHLAILELLGVTRGAVALSAAKKKVSVAAKAGRLTGTGVRHRPLDCQRVRGGGRRRRIQGGDLQVGTLRHQRQGDRPPRQCSNAACQGPRNAAQRTEGGRERACGKRALRARMLAQQALRQEQNVRAAQRTFLRCVREGVAVAAQLLHGHVGAAESSSKLQLARRLQFWLSK